MDRRCKQCEQPLNGMREDAIFCQKRCRNKYNKRRHRILDKSNSLEKELKSEKEFVEYKEEELENIKEIENTTLTKLNEELATKMKKRIQLEKLASFSFDKMKKWYFEYIRKKLTIDSDEHITLQFGNREERNELVQQGYSKCRGAHQWNEEEIDTLRKKIRKLTKQTEGKKQLKDRILLSCLKQLNLDQQLNKLKEIDLDNLPTQPTEAVSTKNRSTRGSFVQGYSGSQILEMKFEEVQLSGELGKFLGKLQRDRCAIALTGDAGVGKSTFSFHIAKLFLKQKMSIAYFALETSLSKRTQEMIAHHGLDKYNFKAFGEGKLTDVRYHANKFDCVFIDSFSMISTKAQDFENLRQDFPETFFVIVFQKTTDGKIRGGSSIIFNCTASIDLQMSAKGHRLAFMQKSRYDSENFVYSINQDELLKGDKLPIKWVQIKENWLFPTRS